MRFIHLKEEIPKLFSQIVVEKAKPNIFENMTKFQIAGKPGHQPMEHVFILMSLIALHESNNKSMLIAMYDIRKMFDKENTEDIMNELYKCKIQGKIYRFLYHMNEDRRIVIETPVGKTKEGKTKAGISQGTANGCMMSSVGIYKGIEE